jgi:hypothetical protein
VRRQAIERIGAFEECFRGMFEDQVFFYKIFLQAPVFVEGGSWDRYRIHADSHTKMMAQIGEYDLSRRPNPAYHKFLLWFQDYLHTQGFTDPDLWSALDSELWPYRHPVASKLLNIGRRAKDLSCNVLHKRLIGSS